MKHIAIIGVGPRGLSALEQLFISISKNKKALPIKVTLFDTAKDLGAGRVWNTSQPDINWLNISQRALKELKGREEIQLGSVIIPKFPGYVEWLPNEKKNSSNSSPDLFPPRSQMGEYLKARFSSISKPLLKHKYININNEEIYKVEYKGSYFQLYSKEENSYKFDEVVLTIGHQPTELSEQLSSWKEHTEKNDNLELFTNPYPVTDIINSTKINNKTVVGIRGLGLAMIDDVRALTIERGGSFEIIDNHTFKSKFNNAKDVPSKIVPFSLDGKPPVPKPLNGVLDELFTPTNNEQEQFSNSIKSYTSGEKKTSDITFLRKAIAQIAANRYIALRDRTFYSFNTKSEAVEVIAAWLDNDTYNHQSIYPASNNPETAIVDFIAMAVNGENISLDYCLGQVWRHCHPIMYKLFSHAQLTDEVMADVVALDERIKRYSYGPPVESMQQLLALYNAGILVFDFANDPDIELVEQGWELKKDNKTIITNCMMNSILASPQLLKVNAPIITNLFSDDLLKPVHSKLGVNVYSNGCIVLPDSDKQIPLAILGRLSKGSVLGVDAILECFRLRIDDWADGVIERILVKK